MNHNKYYRNGINKISDFFIDIFLCTDFKDHLSIKLVNKTFYNIITSNKFIEIILKRLLSVVLDLNIIPYHLDLSLSTLLIQRTTRMFQLSSLKLLINDNKFDYIYKYLWVLSDHFPCLNNPNSNNNNKKIQDNNIIRCLSPFTTIHRSINNLKVTLSCISYYEVTFQSINTLEYNLNNKINYGIGVTKSLLLNETNIMSYNCDGKCYNNKNNAGINIPTYNIGDTIGCGLIYPPLSNSNACIFFTKNGNIVINLNFGKDDFFSNPLYPVIVSDYEVTMDINLGIKQPFLFNIEQYEELLFKQLNIVNKNLFYQSYISEQESLGYVPRHPIIQSLYTNMYHNVNSNITNKLANYAKKRKQEQIDDNISYNNLSVLSNETTIITDESYNVNTISDGSSIVSSSASTSIWDHTYTQLSNKRQSIDKHLNFDNLQFNNIINNFNNSNNINGYNNVNSNGDNQMAEDTQSVATSLLVEVASVDEDGLYAGYGGASNVEEDLDQMDDVMSIGYIATSPEILSHSPISMPLPPPYDAPTVASGHSSVSNGSFSNSNYNEGEAMYASRSVPGSVDDWSLYGYDGGSERCRRDDESDFGVDNDVYIEEDSEVLGTDLVENNQNDLEIMGRGYTYHSNPAINTSNSIINSISSSNTIKTFQEPSTPYPMSFINKKKRVLTFNDHKKVNKSIGSIGSSNSNHSNQMYVNYKNNDTKCTVRSPSENCFNPNIDYNVKTYNYTNNIVNNSDSNTVLSSSRNYDIRRKHKRRHDN